MEKRKTVYVAITDDMVWGELFTTIDKAKKYAEENLSDYERVDVYKCELAVTGKSNARMDWK